MDITKVMAVLAAGSIIILTALALKSTEYDWFVFVLEVVSVLNILLNWEWEKQK